MLADNLNINSQILFYFCYCNNNIRMTEIKQEPFNSTGKFNEKQIFIT